MSSGQGERVDRNAVRRELDKVVADVVLGLLDAGWTVVRKAHKFRVYCPCGSGDGVSIPVNGTPRDPDSHAKRIARLARHCPDSHEHVPGSRAR